MSPDYGLDYTVEIFDVDGRAAGLSFHAQLKATDQPDLARALGGVRFPRETADYYRSLALPVLVVLFHAPSQQLFGRWFHAYNPHLASSEGRTSDAKSIRFQFYDNDLFVEETPDQIEAGLRGFLKFRAPELALPLRVAVSAAEADGSIDAYRIGFALRRVLAPVSDLVSVEVKEPAPDDPLIALGTDRAVVSLADVASVTLDHEEPAYGDTDRYAADLALALSVALAYVGQANLTAQIAFAVGASSTIITDPEASMTVAGAMFRSRRIQEAINLADALDSSEDEDTRVAAFAFLTVLLARGDRLTDEERRLALAMAEQRLQRRLERGDTSGAASEAYSLAMLHKRLRNNSSAIGYFRQAAELDERYLGRAYYHSDFAGVLFENGDYAEAAEHYGRSVELSQRGLTLALHADALLFSGSYEASQRRLDEYLCGDPGPEAAEWRLKRLTLSLLIETVGGMQDRQPDAAENLLRPWDFEKGPDITFDEAWQVCSEAVALDACSGRAWFRLGLLAAMGTDEPREGARLGIAGAVLHRDNENAWTNAVLFSDPADETVLSDLLYAGYLHCGDTFVRQVTEAVAGAEHFQADSNRVIELLDQAVVRVDTARQTAGFTFRVMGEAGEMHELVFGPGEDTDISAPPEPRSVVWRPPSPKPKPPKRKRPAKTHGQTKRRKRRKRRR
jgi:tetratricopeptide (TPR) repeat protein